MMMPSSCFYDVEVFPNLFLVNWKIEGEGKPVVRMINPTPTEIEELMRFRLVGFNCRRYDNHILYARLMGYTNEQLYNLSTKIINGSAIASFGEAYNVSYTDVYDFSSKKQSLKKFEIELGIHHQNLVFPGTSLYLRSFGQRSPSIATTMSLQQKQPLMLVKQTSRLVRFWRMLRGCPSMIRRTR